MTAAATAKAQKLTPLAQRIPEGAWDSHMHIIDPKNYPLSADAIYVPNTYTLADALEFEATVGIHKIVLVQPSIYGNDNSCLLDALRALGPNRGRGVVGFDPRSTSQETLREWHELGVRGVRINLQSVGKTASADELASTLKEYADAVRPLDWVIQVYVPLKLVELLESIIPTLGVRVCIDHLGHPDLPEPYKQDAAPSRDPYELAGFASLIRLLKAGKTFVKMSAPYRISRVPDMSDLEPIAKEVLKVAGKNRVVFATDWPHTRYEGMDISPWMEQVLDWCGSDSNLSRRVFTANAEDLWKVKN